MGYDALVVAAHHGRIDAAEAVRHLNGAAANGFQATLLLLDDGVYLAKAGEVPSPEWTDLALALADALGRGTGRAMERRVEVYALEAAVRARGLTADGVVPGCAIVDDATAAGLLAAADATLVY